MAVRHVPAAEDEDSDSHEGDALMRCDHGFEWSAGLCPECTPLSAERMARPKTLRKCKRCLRVVARDCIGSNGKCVGGCREVIEQAPATLRARRVRFTADG